jgi:ankyrin repeat protein
MMKMFSILLVAFLSLSCFSTPLIDAVIAHNVQEVQKLIDEEIDVNELNEKNETALMHAAWIGLAEIIDILLKADAN